MLTSLELIERYGEKISVKRRTKLTQVGEVERYVYYVNKGMVRMYTYNRKGKKCTFDFVPAGDYAYAFESFKFDTPSDVVVETVTNCDLYRFSKETITRIMQSNEVEIIHYIDAIENTFLRKLNREISLIRDSKFEQYCQLIKDRKDLFENIPLKYIASYLGVSAHTISRFRKEVKL